MPWDATRSPACPRTSSPSSSQPRTGYPRPRGSDWPVTSADPLAGIHVAVNRAGHEAPPGTPLLAAGQALPLPGALPAYTAGSAWINHVEHLAGTIRTGMRADLVVLDRDPFEGPAEELAHARVDRIYVDGQLVHRSG
ncbi:amidohydrolase family protein [Amycolatopsis sp. NPDC005003]